jgi:hypothetical protein
MGLPGTGPFILFVSLASGYASRPSVGYLDRHNAIVKSGNVNSAGVITDECQSQLAHTIVHFPARLTVWWEDVVMFTIAHY